MVTSDVLVDLVVCDIGLASPNPLKKDKTPSSKLSDNQDTTGQKYSFSSKAWQFSSYIQREYRKTKCEG
eukprot:2251062-Amphidinium_carterae.1